MGDTSDILLSGSSDMTIKVWSFKTFSNIMTLVGHCDAVTCLSLTDSHRTISGSLDRTIKLWGLESAQRLVTLRSHTDGVTCLQFNDFFIVSGSYDKTVKLWDFPVC